MTEKNIVLSFEERLSKVKMPSGKRNTLLAAMKLFAAQGFHGTSTAQIAEVAGVSQATIFKYFKTKEELLIGVLEPMAELLSAPFIQNIMKFSKKEDIVHYFIYDRSYWEIFDTCASYHSCNLGDCFLCQTSW